jgi:hypothetical protein
MIAVKVGEEPGNRPRADGNDSRQCHRATAFPEPPEHSRRILEWIDHDPLISRFDLDACPAKPLDPHLFSTDRR